jgi:hypothetical protein
MLPMIQRRTIGEMFVGRAFATSESHRDGGAAIVGVWVGDWVGEGEVF